MRSGVSAESAPFIHTVASDLSSEKSFEVTVHSEESTSLSARHCSQKRECDNVPSQFTNMISLMMIDYPFSLATRVGLQRAI